MKIIKQSFFVLLLLLLWVQPTLAVPDNVSYQGYLTNSSGTPINSTINITFNIYSISMGGTPLWTETQSVTVSNGLLSVKLGGGTFPANLFDTSIWLGVTVDGDAEMAPRKAFDSTAFAFKADDADTVGGLSAASLDQSAHVGDTANPHSVTAAQVGAASAGDIATGISVHSSDTAAHHTKYTDVEAVDAMGLLGDTNALNHDRYADSEAVAAIKAGDGTGSTLDADLLDGLDSSAFMTAATDDWVNITGDTMTGPLTVNGTIDSSTAYQIGGQTVLKIPSSNLVVGFIAGQSLTTGDLNTFLGNAAGHDNTSGSYNTFTGIASGNRNTTGNNNTFSGYWAGTLNTTGSNNTFLGYEAGWSNKTSGENTFVGHEAGYKNTDGIANTFLGSNTGWSNTSGLYNLFSGFNSGLTNTTGSENTFLGAFAGSSNTIGSYNLFSGYQVGSANTTGEGNTFSGYQAGSANTIGDYNTFSGYKAGIDNTTGRFNTFTGTLSGWNNTSGSYNSFAGYWAGNSNSTGNYNTFLGGLTAFENISGNSNTILGYRAGNSNVDGDGNIFLGHLAGYSETASNKLYIDNSNTSSPLIWGDFANDLLNVNGRLSVNGITRVQGDTWPSSGKSMEMAYSSASNKGYIQVYDRDAASWGDLLLGSGYIGIGTSSPLTRLHVARSINLPGTTANHVSIIENTSAGTSPDVLALKVGTTSNPGAGVNFITFINGADASLGSIQGNGSGSVTLAGAGNDYAEYLPLLNKDEVIARADIVGVFNGKVSKNTKGAGRAMVVSSNPIISGNDPGEEKRKDYSLVAFIGQAEVKVRGTVNAGDYLVPDGEGKGVGIAVSAKAITAEQFTLVVGKAWESSSEKGIKNIRALVGLQHDNPVMNKLVAQNQKQAELLSQQSHRLNEQEKEIAKLHAEFKNVMQQVAQIKSDRQLAQAEQ